MFDHRWSIGDQGSFDVCPFCHWTWSDLHQDDRVESGWVMLVPFVWAPKQPTMPGPKNRPQRKRPLLEQTATGAGPWRPGLAQGRCPESSLNRCEFAELAAQADTEHPEALRRTNAS